MTSPDHPSRRFAQALQVLREAAVLPSAASFASAIRPPSDMMMAFATDRTELLALAKPRDLKADDVKALYALIGTMMETNQALRAHLAGVGELIALVDELITNYPVVNLASLPEMVAKLLDFCRFEDDLAHEIALAKTDAKP